MLPDQAMLQEDKGVQAELGWQAVPEMLPVTTSPHHLLLGTSSFPRFHLFPSATRHSDPSLPTFSFPVLEHPVFPLRLPLTSTSKTVAHLRATPSLHPFVPPRVLSRSRFRRPHLLKPLLDRAVYGVMTLTTSTCAPPLECDITRPWASAVPLSAPTTLDRRPSAWIARAAASAVLQAGESHPRSPWPVAAAVEVDLEAAAAGAMQRREQHHAPLSESQSVPLGRRRRAPRNDVDLLALVHSDGDEDDRTRGDAQLALDIYLRDQDDRWSARFAHPARGFARRELALLRGWAAGRPRMTRTTRRSGRIPGRRTGGQGKEVIIDVDAEKEGVSTLLVCARCLDPLLVRSDGITDGGEEEARRRKVWGLRCGHLIDGKCFEELRKPVEVEDPDSGALDARERPPSPEPEGKGKGKGKAKAPEITEEEQEQPDDLFDEDTTNNIRSRLRRRAPPKRKAKAKPKPKPRKPVVEARYEWTCPVAGCGRVHLSEKIDGVWVNAAERGAIGVFV
ncbi:hypothetical protein B0H13DRAFT_2659705 [Mycena leptocephala]|nr:hypothetical protein B0H13DRAFT_2659705 [Mycena leptocephala]